MLVNNILQIFEIIEDNSKISKIEKGQVNITFTTILQLAKALEVEPAELLQTDFD